MDDIRSFIRRLPKAELHLHLEGTITPATLVALSQRHDATPITLPAAEALYQFTDFTGFIEAFKAVTRQLMHAEDYELAAWRMMQHLAEQGVVQRHQRNCRSTPWLAGVACSRRNGAIRTVSATILRATAW